MVKILVVEDDQTLLKIMCAVLTKKGYHAIPAGNGAEALDVMEKEHIDLMVSDIMMPEIDGYELTACIREAGYTFPILIVTAKEKFEDKKRGFGSGADDYIIKPINMKELVLSEAAQI